MQLHSFDNASLLTQDLTTRLVGILKQAIAQRGRAYLVVSGGKTPIDLFKSLAQTELPWDKVTITLADERCVPLQDENRNERLVKQFLVQHHAAHVHFLSLFDEHLQSVASIEHEIASLPSFDAVILGMGEDGHTASLFPDASELRMGLDDNAASVLFVTPRTTRYQRVSLSKKRLLNSRVIFLHLLGQKKLAVLHQAMAQPDPMIMPVSAFLHNQQVNVQVMYAP
ncbi:MAG: 6-phosphogluconolactonase [Legionella sp.]|uniref:6-phosphogluconolactonase n=1 Tax=Legionella sp. TaxID=459 RepID=UPI0039E32C9D